jgi:hypothetical protein
MTFPAFESLGATIEPGRQLLQGASMIRDRATLLGVAIDGGTATSVDLIRWLIDLKNILAPMQTAIAISGMQATVRTLVGNGSLDLAAERTALIAAIAAARTAAQALVPAIAPTWDAATGTIRATAPLTPGANLTAFRAALTALVATIAPGA